MTLISMFFAPVWTTSSRLFTVSLMASSRDRSSLWFFSKNSRTVLDDLPMALAYPTNLSIIGNTTCSCEDLPSTRCKYRLALSGISEAWYHVDRNRQ